MNLLDLYIKLSVDDQASSQMEQLTSGMIAKAEVMANMIQGAFQKAIGAIQGVVGGAVNAYSEYQQQVGGIETFFGDAADTVIENAKAAYETAGMSANQYMRNVSSFAMSLIESVKRRRVAVVQEGAEEETEAQAKALDQQVADYQAAMTQQVTAQQRTFAHQTTAYSDMLQDQLTEYSNQLSRQLSQRQRQLAKELSEYQKQLAQQVEERRKALSDELDELSKSLQRQVEERQKANAREIKEIQKANQAAVSERSKALDKELREYQKSLQREVDAFREATDARIAEIDREYTERLKLTDEEEYRRLKEIDDQIDALDAQTDAEQRAIREREQDQKLANLRSDVENAKFREDRVKAEEELADYLADLEQRKREDARETQKDALREQREQIRTEYEQRKEQIKSEESEVVQAYRDARAEELEALQESNSEKLDQRREDNQAVIEQMREEQQEQLDAVREGQAAEIEQMREHNSEVIDQRKEDNQAIIDQMVEENAAQVEQRREANEEEIRQLQEHNQRLLTERQRANRDALTAMQESQQDQLRAMQEGHAKQLQELREHVAKQKQILAGEGQTENFIETTLEDQEEAARLADIALVDMSDNANKMGSDLGSLQYAYQGFAKQNFMMLDNLKLGFGGTRAEAERMLETAESIKARNGEMVDYSIDSFADIVEAIHTVQEEYYISGMSAKDAAAAVEAGTLTFEEAQKLMGTTAKEGATTVQGSYNQMQAAWENFLISLADPDGKVDESLETLLSSVETYLDNIVPIVERILDRLIPIVTTKGEEIAHRLWDAIYNAIPEEEREKFGGIIDTINNIVNAAINAGDKIPVALAVIGGVTAFNTLATTISNAKGALDLLMGALGLGGGAAAAAGGATLAGAAEAAGTAAEAAAGKFTVLEGGLSSAGGAATAAAGEMAGAEAAAGTLGAGLETVAGIAGTGITGGMVAAGAAILALGIPILKAVGENEQLMESIKGVVTDVDTLATETEVQTGTMTTSWSTMGDKVKTTAKEASDAITVNTGTMTGSWRGAVEGMANDAETNMGKAKDSVKTHTDAAKQTVEANAKESKDKWVNAWKEMYEGTDAKAKETKDRVDRLRNDIDKSFDGTEDMLKPAGANIMTGFWDGLVEAFNNGKNLVTDIATWIKNNKGPEEYDKRLLVENGQWIMEGLYSGIQRGFETDIMPYVGSMAKAMEGAFGSPRLAPSVNVAGRMASGGGGAGAQDMPRQLTVILELDRRQFGHLVYNLNNEQTQRVGLRLR